MPEVTVYKSPSCGCCSKWVQYLQDNGFNVKAQDIRNMDQVKNHYSIPKPLQSCHTAVVDGYLVEGHVPANDLKRLLKKKPKDIAGLAVPGMPMGSPGMEGPRHDRYQVLAIQPDGGTQQWAQH